MAFDPRQPRDKDGQWSKSGYGPGQKLKGKFKERQERNPNPTTAGVPKSTRWSKMSSTDKAHLTTSAQFSTQTKSGKVGKLPTLGKTTPRMQAPRPFSPSEPNAHAVQIQTAKALDKDFRVARDKANKDEMKAAIAKSDVPVVKYPSQKPKR